MYPDGCPLSSRGSTVRDWNIVHFAESSNRCFVHGHLTASKYLEESQYSTQRCRFPRSPKCTPTAVPSPLEVHLAFLPITSERSTVRDWNIVHFAESSNRCFVHGHLTASKYLSQITEMYPDGCPLSSRGAPRLPSNRMLPTNDTIQRSTVRDWNIVHFAESSNRCFVHGHLTASKYLEASRSQTGPTLDLHHRLGPLFPPRPCGYRHPGIRASCGFHLAAVAAAVMGAA
jgi:hypothetical protein